MASSCVAPLVGAWIEINVMVWICPRFRSLPSWERGLKSQEVEVKDLAPLVAPLVGAWIEIIIIEKNIELEKPLPSWERGLK